ncbi:MAG TPA: RNA-binding protein [Nannocystis exedens]|nr:RNA-binding protein [Nannocystis exedens]
MPLVRSTAAMRTTLYVGGFALDTSEATLRQLFTEFGEITDLRMILRGSKDGGFAYITFATVHAAEAALSLNGQSLCERPLRVNFAR